MTLDNSEVVIRRALLDPLPWRVRAHPERARTARGTLVRETLVDLAVHYQPILDTLLRMQRLERVQAALTAYARTADAAATALGLEHRRDLLVADGLPMPVGHDVGDLVALAELAPDALEVWAVATAVLNVNLKLPCAVVARAPVRRALRAVPHRRGRQRASIYRMRGAGSGLRPWASSPAGGSCPIPRRTVHAPPADARVVGRAR